MADAREDESCTQCLPVVHCLLLSSNLNMVDPIRPPAYLNMVDPHHAELHNLYFKSIGILRNCVDLRITREQISGIVAFMITDKNS